MNINPNQIIGNSRNNKRSTYNVGDKIIVKLDGKEYSTEIIDKIPNGRYSIIEPEVVERKDILLQCLYIQTKLSGKITVNFYIKLPSSSLI